MQIQSVRLKNIKSYGEGPEAAGITVGFQPGVNRVAGRNGHGKTTIIEALGYALFFAEPEHDESFKLQTYFLRSGEKEAEIDVVFAHRGHAYRVERALGQSKRRSKLIDLRDDSTCAEGDDAVAGCLCRILHADQRMFSPRQLSDLFANLIGVKQGRLTWPFDSKPSAAKEFFEPLLDVAIFRESESKLKEARGRFEKLCAEQELKLAAIQQRIADRSDSREKAPLKEAEVETWRRAVEKSRKLKDEADKIKQALDQKQIAFNVAKKALEEAIFQTKLATQRREQDERLCAESEAATQVLQKTAAGHDIFLKAEERLRTLQHQQTEKAKLQQEHTSAARAEAEWQGKRDAAQHRLSEFATQREAGQKRLAALAEQLAASTKRHEEAKVECAQLASAVAAAQQAAEQLRAWLETAASAGEQPSQAAAAELQPYLNARAEEHRFAEMAREWESKASKAEQARESLAAQLKQIAGGACPFLKEKCRQFDPKAVQSDLAEFEKQLTEAAKQRQASNQWLSQARSAVAAAKTNLLKSAEEKIQQVRTKLEPRDRERVGTERDLENGRRNLEQLERGQQELLERSTAATKDKSRAEGEMLTATRRIADLDDKLKQYADLEQQFGEQQAKKDRHAAEHQSFLQNQSLAARLQTLQTALAATRKAEAEAQTVVRQRTEHFESAKQDFEPEALTRAQEAAAESKHKLVGDERELERVLNDLKKERERLKEWKKACAERARLENETGRLRAAGHLSKLAAKVLRDAAPAVAQHLCNRIAANAQKIFNQINPEPIEVEWKAEPCYGLRIVPGSRRFAMLSGGEQTKLALAMTLAMIQEFSGLHFAVFDEPTYAVDSDSRQKLADAILAAQKAAGLEQLIVVSHDDAFEGKIENVVLLTKTAEGTQIEPG